MRYAKATYKKSYTKRYDYGGEMERQNATVNTTNAATSSIPVYGQILGAANSLSNAARKPLKRDEYGYTKQGINRTAEEWITPFHESAAKSFAAKDYAGALRDITGTGTFLRGLSKGTENDEKTTGFWGKFNNATGISRENRQRAEGMAAQDEAAAAAQAEIDAQLKAEEEFKAKQQDEYNRAYYSINSASGNSGASIYAKYGGKIPSFGEGGNTKKQAQHGSYYKASKKDLDKTWENIYGKSNYDVISDSTDINGKPYYNYYLTEKVNVPIEKEYNPISKSSTTLDPMKQIGFNGMLAPLVEKFSKGGSLNSLASNIVKAEGSTHENGGIKLKDNSGSTYAEVEDQEIIKDNNVYSDRLKLPNGKTMAEEAEKWAKIKGKSEAKIKSGNYRQKNAGTRMSEFSDMKLDNIFDIQEASKVPTGNIKKFYGGGDLTDDEISDGFNNFLGKREYDNAVYNYGKYTPEDQALISGGNPIDNNQPESTSSGSRNRTANWGKIAQYGVPLIDNLYNASLINKTPDIPVPTKKVAYNATAMPMKTSFDVSNNLTEANNMYRQFTKGVDDNTNSSQIARGNKLAGLSQVLKNKSSIYQNKENVETNLKNANNLNIQDVYNKNQANKQIVDNYNLGQTDSYNYAKMLRSQGILDAKSANVANAVEDTTTGIKDYNNSKLDKERMELYANSYPDSSIYSRIMGTSTMNKLANSKSGYERIENSLEKSGQKETLSTFRKKYKKPSK